MTEKRKIVPAVVVEGKYDKIRLESVIDAVILVTDGFQIYRDSGKLALIRHYAETTGVVILTDADAAGFQIRGYLKGAIMHGKVYHVYVPGIHGKERRKRLPSAEGLLGVEGMNRETLLEAFERAGVFEEVPRSAPHNITPAVLYRYGLMGAQDASLRRAALLEALHLPPHISVKGLCDVLCTMTEEAELDRFLQKYLPSEYGEGDAL